MKLFTHWYESREGSIFERRLDTFGHRLMVLLAATTGRHVVGEEITEAVVASLRYQLQVRRESDPVDADNTIAKLEEKIRRALANENLRSRDLKRKVHYDRVGIWIFEQAIANLRRAGEINYDAGQDVFWKVPASTPVTTPVTTSKHGGSANADG